MKTEWEVALENFIRNLYNHIKESSVETEPHIYKELTHVIYSKELVHIIMKAGKFQDLLWELVSWEPRRADDASLSVSL